MVENGRLRFDCSISNSVFPQERGVNVKCIVKTGTGKDIGDFGMVYGKATTGENKLHLDVSNDLFGNLLSESIDIEKLIGGIGSLFL